MTNRTEFVDEQERMLVEAVDKFLTDTTVDDEWVAASGVAALRKARAAYTPKPLDYSKPMPTWEEFSKGRRVHWSKPNGLPKSVFADYSRYEAVTEDQYNAIRDALAKGGE